MRLAADIITCSTLVQKCRWRTVLQLLRLMAEAQSATATDCEAAVRACEQADVLRALPALMEETARRFPWREKAPGVCHRA